MFDWIPILQLGTTGALFAWFIYQYFQQQKVKDNLASKDTERKHDTDEVAETYGLYHNKEGWEIGKLIGRMVKVENDEREIRGNHLKHQEAIENWMKSVTSVLVKICNKLEIPTDELFR